MIQTLTRNWWLLALCGLLDALMSLIYFDHAGSGFHAAKDMLLLGRLMLAAGICSIVAGIWRPPEGRCWPLVMNGLALGALGLLFYGIAGPRITLFTVVLLMVVMAISAGILEWATARTLRQQNPATDAWLLDIAAACSIVFAVVFFALGLHWIRLGPGSTADILWFGAYFGFSAICMVGLALRLHFRMDQPQTAPPFGTPRHA